jgi:hypothetical protein
MRVKKVGARSPDKCVDLECDVQTLAQLVTGYLTAEEATYKHGVVIHSCHAELAALFPKRKIYMGEDF